MPERETTPTLPGLWIGPGMMPILHSPGVMMPGQLGPISRAPRLSTTIFASSMSSAGMPSVMQTISPMPASAASMIESLQNGAGT